MVCEIFFADVHDFVLFVFYRLFFIIFRYRAPEILLGQSYDSAVDIWSAACIIAEMYSRKALFPGTSEGNQLERIFELTGRPAYIHWPRNVSIVWDHFPPLEPKMPRDLCPKLCDSSNELLTVSKYNCDL